MFSEEHPIFMNNMGHGNEIDFLIDVRHGSMIEYCYA